MDVLVEVHDESRARARAAAASRLIGINNRNLKTFETDARGHASGWRRGLPRDRLLVSESGIFTPADLARLARVGVATFLVGESLMRQADVAQATRALLAGTAPQRGRPWRRLSPTLTHIDAAAATPAWSTSRRKAATERVAVADGSVRMARATLDLILAGGVKKGDVLGAARIAGIMARQAHPRSHPAVPSAGADHGRGRPRPRSRARRRRITAARAASR